jgi:hypothetical protein
VAVGTPPLLKLPNIKSAEPDEFPPKAIAKVVLPGESTPLVISQKLDPQPQLPHAALEPPVKH